MPRRASMGCVVRPKCCGASFPMSGKFLVCKHYYTSSYIACFMFCFVAPVTNLGRACEQLKYSEFMFGMKEENIMLNRKVLSEIARFEPRSFQARAESAIFHNFDMHPSCRT